MGVSLSELVKGEPITLADMAGKTLVVDAYNVLYQFLTTIRGPDGAPLTDNDGNTTSHLVGLFSRTTKLMQEGLKLVFVFDGEAPELKRKERERRKQIKEEAQASYEEAKEAEDVEGMRKYAGRTSRLTPDMVKEAEELLSALGIPTIQAPSEGEAQAAHMVHKGDAWALISQDYDCLLFGTPRMVKNLSITARRKKKGTLATEQLEPELITLQDVLQKLGVTRDQLIALGLLIGTDFNVGGIKGIGPKKGLELVKGQEDVGAVLTQAGWGDHFQATWQEAFSLFKHMPVTDDYRLEWKGVDADALHDILVNRHAFSTERVQKTVDRLAKTGQERAQKGLGAYF